MATSIPYDPKLVLGNIVEDKLLQAVEKVAKAQQPVDQAEEALNALIQAKLSLDMTVQEILGMGIDPTEVIEAGSKLDDEIKEAAAKLVGAKVQAYGAGGSVVTAKKELSGAVNSSVESPIDYNKTQIKTIPLSADSIKMDAQYFSYDENIQAAKNTVSAIKSYVSEATSFLGDSRSVEASEAAQRHVSSQIQNHDVAGTLVITAGCTHKNALLLAPFILDVDKAIRVWNAANSEDMIKPDDPKALAKIATKANTPDEKALNILSGATYGSSFVGMVHVLRSESTQSSQQMISAAESLQAQMDAGAWFADEEGGFGISSTFANDVKRMLSVQQISSHVSMIVMGAIPSVKSNQVQIGVKEFADFDPAKMMGKLATLASSTQKEQDTVAASAAAARTGNQMVQIRGAEIQNVMTGLGNIDDGQNKMLDINSLMTAFEDYVNKALAGNIGVPINYYIKPITKSQLAQMWVSKYYPQYLRISGDDSEDTKSPGGDQ